MEIEINGKTFPIADDCPLDAPKPKTLRRHLRIHGAESFMTSQSLGQFAGCVLDDLLQSGARLLERIPLSDSALEADLAVVHGQDASDDSRADTASTGSVDPECTGEVEPKVFRPCRGQGPLLLCEGTGQGPQQ